jgi:hypothetical protein
MKRLLLIACLLCLGPAAVAQDAFYDIFSYEGPIPQVSVNHRSVTLQQNLYPLFYLDRSASRDMRWVARNDTALVSFWETKGDTMLHILTELSGIPWTEDEFDIYLVRFFPTTGSGDPIIIPFGGIKYGSLIEAPPEGNRLKLLITFQLARRMLAQADQPEQDVYLPIAYHPLMQPGAYRYDNLAMLLAINTCYNIIGIDSTTDAWQSAWWQNKFPGWEILQEYFIDEWILTPQQTLADWVLSEPYGSELVANTRPPRRPRQPDEDQGRLYVEELPLKGTLGMAMTVSDQGFPQIDRIDVYRLAYATGLREGDEIRRVDGMLVRTPKDVVEAILEGFDINGGATLQIMRDSEMQSIVMIPIELLPLEEQQHFLQDSLMLDSLGRPVPADSADTSRFELDEQPSTR